MAAEDLRVGETLLLADDSIRRVESRTRRENRETAYNIEVEGEHVFYVGNDGVSVHNECEGWHHLFATYLGSKASSATWWILTALSVGIVLTALQLERKRQKQRMAGPEELPSSALDELFTSDTPWEPPLWNQPHRELAVS